MEHSNSLREDIYKPEMATVLKSEPITSLEHFVELTLDSGMELGHMPGQFVEVSLFGIGEAPISISSSPTQKSLRFETRIGLSEWLKQKRSVPPS